MHTVAWYQNSLVTPGLLRFAIDSAVASPSQLIFRAIFALQANCARCPQLTSFICHKFIVFQASLDACDAEVCVKHPDLKGRLLRWSQSGRRVFKIPERGLFAHVTLSAHPYRFAALTPFLFRHISIFVFYADTVEFARSIVQAIFLMRVPLLISSFPTHTPSSHPSLLQLQLPSPCNL